MNASPEATTSQAPGRARPWVLLAAAIGATPLLVWLNLWSFALRVRLELGHWPRFGDPDPTGLLAAGQRFSVALGLLCFPGFALLAIGLSAWGRWRDRSFPVWGLVSWTSGATGLMLLLLWFDPGGLVNWFVD